MERQGSAGTRKAQERNKRKLYYQKTEFPKHICCRTVQADRDNKGEPINLKIPQCSVTHASFFLNAPRTCIPGKCTQHPDKPRKVEKSYVKPCKLGIMSKNNQEKTGDTDRGTIKT
jgi:hypothetical protein